MFKKILVANRGEIAVRVMRACHELGIKPVAVFSDADRRSLHVRMADEAWHIGASPSSESYLLMDRIIDVAKKSGVDAIHPGYGFLSENAVFAQACADAGLVFIGPTPHAISAMGSKLGARQLMMAAGVPVVPGTLEPVREEAEARRIAHEIGYPVMLKASAGGGGKGMRLVHSEDELVSALRAARSESIRSFGDDAVYIEKFVNKPRHVEMQVFGDNHGNFVHLFERDCSIQRRHQKVVEESPCPVLRDDVRQRMAEVAVKAARAVNYVGAGTIEFLIDDQQNFYFLEMNTRLQVEHPVTELVTGFDLVHAQIAVAEGKPMPFRQEQIVQRGAAIECRVYAEDPFAGFAPSPGPISELREPGGPWVRIDGGAYRGWEVPIFYDSLIAKLCVWGSTRQEAIRRMHRALGEYVVKPIRTTIPFHRMVMENPRFIAGDYTTGFIGQEYPNLVAPEPQNPEALALVAALAQTRRERSAAPSVVTEQQGSSWRMTGRWRNGRF